MAKDKVWQCMECGRAWSQESRHTCPKCKSTDIDVYVKDPYKGTSEDEENWKATHPKGEFSVY